MIANSLSILLSGVLAMAGLIHLAWALGSTFPYANEQALARAVVGRRGITRMPSMAASAFVASCLLGAAGWALLLDRMLSLPVSDWLVAPGDWRWRASFCSGASLVSCRLSSARFRSNPFCVSTVDSILRFAS